VNMPVARRIYTESGLVDNCIASQEITCFSLNDSSASTQRICEDHFGEQPLSFRSLLKRFVTTDVLASPGSTTSNCTITIMGEIYPPNNMPFGFTGGLKDLFSYLRLAYLGVRGGVRIRTRTGVSGGFPNTYQTKVSLLSPTTTGIPTTYTVGAYQNSRATLEGTLTFCLNTNAGVEFELPYYSSNLFSISFSGSYVPPDANDNICEDYFRSFGYYQEYTGSAVVVFEATLERASGEDFDMMRFCGAPQYTT